MELYVGAGRIKLKAKSELETSRSPLASQHNECNSTLCVT